MVHVSFSAFVTLKCKVKLSALHFGIQYLTHCSIRHISSHVVSHNIPCIHKINILHSVYKLQQQYAISNIAIALGFEKLVRMRCMLGALTSSALQNSLFHTHMLTHNYKCTYLNVHTNTPKENETEKIRHFTFLQRNKTRKQNVK